jgi:hypothetical protein
LNPVEREALMARRSRRISVAAVGLVAAVLMVGGCSSGDSSDAKSKASSTTTTVKRTTTVAPTLPPVPASGGVTITPDPIPVTAGVDSVDATVAWQGQKPKALIFLRVCRKSITDPTFVDGIDCSLLSEQTPNGTADGNGSIVMPIFRGQADNGDANWGCFAPTDTAPPGVQKNTTCYVRVTNDVTTNTTDDREAPFTFVAR